MPDTHTRVNPAFVLAQLDKAARALLDSPDEEARARAVERVGRWRRILEGMELGTLQFGSRTPVDGVPAWATLEVAHGGFATGGLLAEGPLLPHEEARLAALPGTGGTERGRLNRWFLAPEGRDALLAAVQTGHFRVDVPEEAALAVVAWLIARGDVTEAADLVEALLPFLDRLRFYPAPADTPQPTGALVHRASAAEVAEGLRKLRVPESVARMNETLAVWQPLCDRYVALFLETVEGDAPRFETDAAGRPARGARGQEVLVGGWPCRRWPGDWFARATALLREHQALRARHRLCRRPDDPKGNLARLRVLAERAVERRGALSDQDAGWVRRILAACVARRGVPGSETHAALRAEQRTVASRPPHAALARVVATRLEPVPKGAGIPAVAPFLAPVRAAETADVPPGSPMPPAFAAKLARCLEAPVDELVRRGVLPSAEVLAEVLPQVTAQVVAAGFDDPALLRLYTATYAAFRRRRSLLLLDYARQVQLHELPWIGAVQRYRADGEEPRRHALRSLRHAAALALTTFPHTLLPNPLITELAALARSAGLGLPWVDELAADIFMGAFTPKFVRAADLATTLLAGTLYARYYDLPERLPAPRPGSRLPGLPPAADAAEAARVHAFAELCRARATEAGYPRGGGVAANGTVIEQAQILTTHNLAPLFHALRLQEACRPALPGMAERCFREVVCKLARHHDARQVVRKLARHHDARRIALAEVKNAAYAWRQMVFYLSFVGDDDVARILATASRLLAETRRGLAPRLEPALRGLREVVAGGRFGAHGTTAGGGRRFLGWAAGEHWLLAGSGG